LQFSRCSDKLIGHSFVPIGLHKTDAATTYRVHKVATFAFWRTFHQEGKINPGW
jgi:hypothetical protein